MKILLTHRYFWPDSPPYGVMLRTIAAHLAGQGHDVHVFASIPSYRADNPRAPSKETVDGFHVRRIRVFTENKRNVMARLANLIIYCIGLFVHILRQKPDVVTASTFPPVLAGWVACSAARMVGAKFVYHMQDIHPEVSEYSGGRLGRGLVRTALLAIDNHTLRRSAAIVTLSRDMRATLDARGLPPLPIHVINNFPLDAVGPSDEPPSSLRKDPNKIRVIFAGNLGNFQNLPLLAEGISTRFEKYPNLELFFLGEGAALATLKATWSDHPQVRFAPFVPVAQARVLIAEADVGLVSLAPDIYRVAYPSKVLTYAALGLRMLALVETGSHLARDLEANSLGNAPEDSSPDAIGQALDRVLALPPVAGENDTNFKLEQWTDLVSELA